MSVKYDVSASYELLYNEKKYVFNNENKESKEYVLISNFEVDMHNKKDFYKDTSNYDNITFNKKNTTIDLFNKIDLFLINLDKGINRYYLKKCVAYQYKIKFLSIQINQSELLVSFVKDIKKYDNLNKLLNRKGYENDSLCYYLKVNDFNDTNYIEEMLRQYFKNINICNNDNINNIDNLYKCFVDKVLNIGRDIILHEINKGLVFKRRRNFVFICKRSYGLFVKLLEVEDESNTLSVVGTKNIDPLARSYKIKDFNDMELIMPYILKSYNKAKYNPVDLKNGIVELYVNN